MSSGLRLISIIRFLVAGLITIVLVQSVIRTFLLGYIPFLTLAIGIIQFSFITYMVAQGIRELKEDKLHAGMLRFFAILMSFLIILVSGFRIWATVIYLRPDLIELLVSVSLDLSTLIGTGFVLIEDVKISLNRA